MSIDIQEFHDSYELLVPPQEEGMVIYALSQKIERNEIDANFTYQDLQLAIVEVSSLSPGRQPHTERILKDLLHYMIERPSDKRNRYKLTEYALNFIKLATNKLKNPYRNFPLRESFKQYGLFKPSDIKSIYHFQSWYEQGFNSTTRQTIIEHLEALKDDVDKSIRSLNDALYSPHSELLGTVHKFVVAFQSFGEKAEEIRDTLRLSVKLGSQIDVIVSTFYQTVEKCKHPQNEEEQRNYEKAEGEFLIASQIQKQVSDFFSVVDEKLAQLKDRILFSSTKLTELQDNFRYQTDFKINIKNFLVFLLSETKYSKDGLSLPHSFPKKSIPVGFARFVIVKYYEFFSPVKNRIITPARNQKYKSKEKAKIDLELLRQENTVKWVSKYKRKLIADRLLDFTPIFYEILREEKDVEIPLQVGFELFQFANSSNKKYEIKVDRSLLKEYKNESIVTWRMKILMKS